VHPLQEQHLFERFESDRSMGLTVSCADLRNQMLEFTALINPRFKASNGWLTGFKKRFNLALRRATTFIKTSTRSTNNGNQLSFLGGKIHSFHAYLQRKIYLNGSLMDVSTPTIWTRRQIKQSIKSANGR
jgi:hypothetical protein